MHVQCVVLVLGVGCLFLGNDKLTGFYPLVGTCRILQDITSVLSYPTLITRVAVIIEVQSSNWQKCRKTCVSTAEMMSSFSFISVTPVLQSNS